MSGWAIIGDREVPCSAEVSTWREHGIEFKVGEGHNKRRARDIDLIVLHWTGGEGAPDTMAAALRRKKLGIEFAVHKGVIWQFCDPLEVDTADAGIVNPRSAGVEIVNYGFRRSKADIPRTGQRRPTYKCDFRGRRRTFAHFWPEDIAATIALCEMLAKALHIPRCVPVDGEYWVAPRTLYSSELEAFKGFVGHFHISDRKADPGLDILEALRATWALIL